MSEKLTPEGEAWAWAHVQDSLVARVALVAGPNDWPETHRRAAIKACNDAATAELRRDEAA